MKIKSLSHVTMAVAISTALLAGCSSNTKVEDPLNKRLVELQTQQEEMIARQKALKQRELEAQIKILPKWVESPPNPDSTGFYGVGIGQSKQVNHSRRSARLQAEFELATQYKNEINGSERAYERGNASGEVDTQATFLIDRIIDAVPIVGYQVVDQQIKAQDGMLYTYVLLKLPYDQFNIALQQQRQNETDDRVQSQFDDLERRLSIRREQRLEDEERMHRRNLEQMDARDKVLRGQPVIEEKDNSEAGEKTLRIEGL